MFQTENVVTCHPANRILNLQNRLWQYQNSSTKSITTAAVSNLSCFWILSGNTQVELHFKTGNFFNRYQFTATLIFHKTTAGSLIMNDIDCCEEMACDEAELGPDEFEERLRSQQKLQEEQLEMLKHMRKFHLDDQSAILEKLHQQMEETGFENAAMIFSLEQIQEIVRRRVSPLFRPR
ncbi:uncharacterized protein LOC110807448 isoform X2 [Carica papaya]|uniref:uncharacterized protein LOC110807448 isoform X2 n=1 Tax=Carica papaya TaxID=3649 RepID=UPI000B8CDFAE|nr:uncharacterized protein LOC110807448 isoform X2 [Carica papaya]